MTTNPGEIIVPVEWSPRSLGALRAARVLAEQSGRHVQIVSVIPTEAARDDRLEKLAGAADRYGIKHPEIAVLEEEVKVKSVGREGGALLNYLDERPDAWVCMATHARGAIGDMVLGSVASGIIHHGHPMVVLAGPQFNADWNGPLRTLFVCLDGSKLSEAVIAPAAEMAARTGATLMLLQVLDVNTAMREAGNDVAESGYLQARAREIQANHDLKADWEVLHGKVPARAIAEYVAGFPGAMVAMTTHGYTGIHKLNIGSVTHDVVHMVSCPVLTFKPKNES